FDATTHDRRYEAKLTANLSDRHTLQASYIKNDTSMDHVHPTDLTLDTITRPSFPNDLAVLRYAGVLGPALFSEAQYSQKKFRYQGLGGSNPDIRESPFQCATQDCFYNGLYFDATDPERRDNKQLSASVSAFLSPARLGSHDLKVGVESFRNLRTGGNSQSASNYVFGSDFLADPVTGKPVLDSNGRAIPVFVPNTFQSYLIFWDAQRGSRFEVQEDALYVNDAWRVGDRWSFNLGGRFERATNSGTDRVHTIDSRRLVPRLAASLDPRGDGRYRLAATYAQYAGSYNLALFTNGTNTGNPGYLFGPYIGPPGQGRDFAPGFDPKNYALVYAGSPTQNVRFAKGTSSPLIKEYTLSSGLELARTGFLKATYVNRRWTDLLEDFTALENGTVQIVIQGVPGPPGSTATATSPGGSTRRCSSRGATRRATTGRSRGSGPTRSKTTATTRARSGRASTPRASATTARSSARSATSPRGASPGTRPTSPTCGRSMTWPSAGRATSRCRSRATTSPP
ncbi:MAG TPA: hypothetical protein VGR07_03740, partial [Thermoanaerobaculia bacterium]|nr:hypothetical protein [Thermoanaerobaculia bacterium]